MLFNSFQFLFIFLPLSLGGACILSRLLGMQWSLWFTVLSSIYFCASFGLEHLAFLLCLLIFNYISAVRIAKLYESQKKILFVIVIFVDIAILAWCKYSFFLKDSSLFSIMALSSIPIGISFYTFQLIAYQADLYRRRADVPGPGRFAFFITFFPQLIAGPIVHYTDVLPQLSRIGRANLSYISTGMFFLAIGLFKKVCIADKLGSLADTAFSQLAVFHTLPPSAAWQGLLAFSMQIYFDFSAYSDIAIGLGLMFGICLPINFLSPYRAIGFRDFWRRWHITLSRFLRDYLYIPLGGNRKGLPRTMANVIMVMSVAGIWHGAGWTFLLWGLGHGTMIAMEHLTKPLHGAIASKSFLKPVGILATFAAITMLWVLFRSPSLSLAFYYYKSLFSMGSHPNLAGFSLSSTIREWILHPYTHSIPWIAISLTVTWFVPNMVQLTRYSPVSNVPFKQPGIKWGIIAGVAIWMVLKSISEGASRSFIYFAF